MMRYLPLLLLLPLFWLAGCQEDIAKDLTPEAQPSAEPQLKADLTEGENVARLVVSTSKKGNDYKVLWASVKSAVKYRVRYELQGSYFEQESWSASTGFSLKIEPGETYSIEVVAADSNNEIIAKTNGYAVTNKVNMLNDLAQ